jgi:hypothetical protein
LKLNKFIILPLLILSFLFREVKAQQFSEAGSATGPPVVPEGYFSFPTKPGKQNFLSGSMGELRPNHFHGGLDIKTDGVIGQPIYAAADGYVSRIKASTYGYGNIIYLTHPNGLVTTYAHLDGFIAPLADFVRQEQYQKQVFEIELFPAKDQFVFQKGEQIAFSGNTGGSGGPHLHWEIRDQSDNLLSPLKYGFVEIIDNIPPEIVAVAIRPMDIEARVNGQFARQQYSVLKQGSNYVLKDTIFAFGLIGLEINTFDKLNGANNRNGVQRIDLLVNNTPVYGHEIHNIPMEKNRMISVHLNYPHLQRTGTSFQKCYVDDGNTLPIYQTNATKGKFRVMADSVYQARLEVRDAYNNLSVLEFAIRGRKPVYNHSLAARPAKQLSLNYEVDGNVLKITATDTAREVRNVELYQGRLKYAVLPSYTHQSNTVYLYNLQAGLPDSIGYCGLTRKLTFSHTIPSGVDYSFSNRYMDIRFSKESLFDTLFLKTDYLKDVFTVQDIFTPLFGTMQITLRPQKEIVDKERSAVYSVNGGRRYLGGSWDGNSITFATKNPGKFAVLTDTTPPTVKLVSKSPTQVRFTIRDDLSGIASFRAEINGEWLLMKYEHKSALIYSEKLDKSVPLSGELVLKVRDMAGNEATYKGRI